jgi:hypothetical protein
VSYGIICKMTDAASDNLAPTVQPQCRVKISARRCPGFDVASNARQVHRNIERFDTAVSVTPLNHTSYAAHFPKAT